MKSEIKRRAKKWVHMYLMLRGAEGRRHHKGSSFCPCSFVVHAIIDSQVTSKCLTIDSLPGQMDVVESIGFANTIE